MAADFSTATIEWGANTITLLELMKDILGVTDNSRDVELSMYLQAGGEACERYIDNKIAQQEVLEKFSHSRHPVVLRYYPITDITSIVIDGEAFDDYKPFTDEGVKYVTDDICATFEISDCFKQMNITYTAGYEPIPADLGYAVVIAGIAYESEQGGVSGSIKRESVVGVGTIEYSTGDDAVSGVGALSPSVIGSLEPYRRYSV